MGFLASSLTALQAQASPGLREVPGVGGGAPAARQARVPPQRPVWGWAAEMYVQAGNAGEEGELFPLAAHLLLAFCSAVA